MGVDKFMVYIILLLSFVVEVLNVFLFVEIEVKIIKYIILIFLWNLCLVLNIYIRMIVNFVLFFFFLIDIISKIIRLIIIYIICKNNGDLFFVIKINYGELLGVFYFYCLWVDRYIIDIGMVFGVVY